jgi:DNA-binding HxlR family transcriptional regulator
VEGDGGPVRVEYALTDAGRGLADAIAALAAWGERFARSAPAR